MFYVYILKGIKRNNEVIYYCGYTSRTPSIRLREHIENVRNRNTNHYTGRLKYVRLVYYESYKSKAKAIRREKEIKKLGHNYKIGLIKGFQRAKRKYK